jgi:hypothetical protein
MSLGPVSRHEARRLADELVVVACRLFDKATHTMDIEEDHSISSPEWIAGIRTQLLAGLALLQNP